MMDELFEEWIQWELMAIIYGIRAFKYILYFRHFKTLRDSKPFSHIKKKWNHMQK